MKLTSIAASALVVAALSTSAVAPDRSARALMLSADGKDVGTITLTQTQSGILHLIVEMTDLPSGPHGFHVHETGRCEQADNFHSAGAHIAGGKEHGILSANGPHPGDLPNVHVGPDGILKVEIFTDRLSLDEGAENHLLDADGSAIVVHADPDDYGNVEAGHAGARIACGVIE